MRSFSLPVLCLCVLLAACPEPTDPGPTGPAPIYPEIQLPEWSGFVAAVPGDQVTANVAVTMARVDTFSVASGAAPPGVTIEPLSGPGVTGAIPVTIRVAPSAPPGTGWLELRVTAGNVTKTTKLRVQVGIGPGLADPAYGASGLARVALPQETTIIDAAVLADGSVIAVGVTSRDAYFADPLFGAPVPHDFSAAIHKVTPAGRLDGTFGTNGILTIAHGHAKRVIAADDGHIVVAGASDGEAKVWQIDGGGQIVATAVLPANRIRGLVRAGAGFAVAGLSATGVVTATLDARGALVGTPVAVTTPLVVDDAIYLTGGGWLVVGQDTSTRKAAMMRLRADGALDTTFGTDGVLLYGTPGLYAAGARTAGGFVVTNGPAATWFTAAGAIDDSKTSPSLFRGLGYEWVAKLGVQDDGKVVAGYTVNPPQLQVRDFVLFRFRTTGELDGTFGTQGAFSVNAALGVPIIRAPFNGNDAMAIDAAGHIHAVFNLGPRELGVLRVLPQ